MIGIDLHWSALIGIDRHWCIDGHWSALISMPINANQCCIDAAWSCIDWHWSKWRKIDWSIPGFWSASIGIDWHWALIGRVLYIILSYIQTKFTETTEAHFYSQALSSTHRFQVEVHRFLLNLFRFQVAGHKIWVSIKGFNFILVGLNCIPVCRAENLCIWTENLWAELDSCGNELKSCAAKLKICESNINSGRGGYKNRGGGGDRSQNMPGKFRIARHCWNYTNGRTLMWKERDRYWVLYLDMHLNIRPWVCDGSTQTLISNEIAFLRSMVEWTADRPTGPLYWYL